ncbi:hypothetical protein CMI37_10505 [Candidatus Pacearchaeota archaeon]|jgi:hypothetical protein|nr:hypothetical protein [Candidatus Pacearchaeota archaeon]|tara:strand:- start:4773 stop:5036 length:264 start_codon:yes stop_codon:yes gene_type:complete
MVRGMENEDDVLKKLEILLEDLVFNRYLKEVDVRMTTQGQILAKTTSKMDQANTAQARARGEAKVLDMRIKYLRIVIEERKSGDLVF